MAGASVAERTATDVVMPGSEEEAIAAFGDGAAVVVVGGGTIVVPDLTYRRRRVQKALMLGSAGLAGIETQGSRVTIGATTPVQELVDMLAPLGPCAANVADLEIRSQGTVGGNLCAPLGDEAPRGDLQSAFLALGATVRSAADGDVSEEPLEDFLPRRGERLLLSVRFDEPAAGAYAGLDRPHTHDYTALGVSGAKGTDGTLRLAATGAGSWGVRLPSAEAAAGDPAAAGEAALQDVTPHDDALASAWYRAKVLPVLVRRVLDELKESA
jgi:aerobic carbon-monoxide dehydrogenase medium subunit